VFLIVSLTIPSIHIRIVLPHQVPLDSALATEELVQVEGSPVIPNPAPRDYYKIPDKYKTGNDVMCNSLIAVPIAAGNLNECAKQCTACDVCTGFVDDSDVGACAFKSQEMDEDCVSPKCNKDGYGKCPDGKWSDGFSTNKACYQAPLGYSRQQGFGPVSGGGTDMTCNNGAATLRVDDYDLQKCADICATCAVGASTCAGFVRSMPDDGSAGAICTFKSELPTGMAVKSTEDAYHKCGPGLWSDGLMGMCSKAPNNYVTKINYSGGNPIQCSGKEFMLYDAEGDLNACGKVCSGCTQGTRGCDGFVRQGGKCHFMSNTKDPAQANNIEFGSVPQVGADAYSKCGDNMASDGTESKCQWPADWLVKVSTGGASDCKCNDRSVNDRRFSQAKWTFDIFDSNNIPLFLSGKPEVQAPCANSEDKKCAMAQDAGLRTSSAGGLPTKVRITADSNDDWCMKSFCIQSKTMNKHWRTVITSTTPQYFNPGVAADGTCLPASVNYPNNNWGWCRYVAGGVQATMSTCNVYNDYRKAYWELELGEGQWGSCDAKDADVVIETEQGGGGRVVTSTESTPVSV